MGVRAFVDDFEVLIIDCVIEKDGIRLFVFQSACFDAGQLGGDAFAGLARIDSWADGGVMVLFDQHALFVERIDIRDEGDFQFGVDWVLVLDVGSGDAFLVGFLHLNGADALVFAIVSLGVVSDEGDASDGEFVVG